MKSNRPHTSAACPCCRAHISVYTIVDCATQQFLQIPNVTSIYGNVYIQGDTPESIGVASYHFESEEDSYIAYDSQRCSGWLLDDNSPPPEKKPFVKTSYDPVKRIFRGTVEWQPVTFSKSARWEYEMIFADDFESIVDGTCSMFESLDPDANPTGVHRFGRNLRYLRLLPTPTTLYGNVFIQHGKEGFASYHFDSEDDVYISYAHELCSQFPALADGSALPVKKPFIDTSYDPDTRTFRGTISWEPTNMMGFSKWEYCMIFGEEFDQIAGTITQHPLDEARAVEKIYYGRQLNYTRLYVNGSWP